MISKQSIRWDEKTIAEHDKERGTRMKIDEPDTPYAYNEYSSSKAPDACISSPGCGKILFCDSLDDATCTKSHVNPGLSDTCDDNTEENSFNTSFSDTLSSKLCSITSEPLERELTQHTSPSARHKLAFKKARSKHYNEFQRMKEFKRRMAAGEISDDD